MRTITENAIQKFLNNENFKSSNTTVEVTKTSTILKLFNNEIAVRNRITNKLSISTCGWKSKTTKERLNGLPNVKITQKNGTWSLNGAEWNGTLTEIN
jgi:hypothetical protein